MHRLSPLTSPFLKNHTFSSLFTSSRSAIFTSPNPTITSMEVEVKLRLPNAVTHQRVSSILSPYHLKTHAQENIFFDGANSELSSKLAVLRLRFYDVDTQCIISLKAKPVISDGISRIEEDEEPIDPSIGRACVSEPWRLPLIDSSRIVRRVRKEYGIGENGLVCLGGFRNVRAVYEWKGLKLELDETHYDFGMNYEIECESCDPERAKDLLEELLKSHGLEYSYSSVSKFAIFRSGKLPHELYWEKWLLSSCEWTNCFFAIQGHECGMKMNITQH